MPAFTVRRIGRTAGAAVPALLLGAGLVASVPAGSAQAAVHPMSAHSTSSVAQVAFVGAAPAAQVVAAGALKPLARPAAPVRPVAATHVTRTHARATRRAAAPSQALLVLRLAAALAGRPYAYGAAGPAAFDCSGFTRYVFGHAVGRWLPHNAAAQYALSHKIAKSAIRPGDLVFFLSYGQIYHVGIYAGHGLIWHAPHTGDHVRLAAIFSSSWVAGRVL